MGGGGGGSGGGMRGILHSNLHIGAEGRSYFCSLATLGCGGKLLLWFARYDRKLGYMVGWLVGGLCIVSYFGTILGPGLILYNAAGSTIHVHDRTEEGEDARIRYERCCTQYHGLGSCPRVQVSFQLLICCCCWVSADGRVLRCGLFVFLCFFFWILDSRRSEDGFKRGAVVMLCRSLGSERWGLWKGGMEVERVGVCLRE